MPAERKIIEKESNFNPKAQNPTTSAFGLCQIIISNREKHAAKIGVHPNTSDPADQLALCRSYWEERYGTAQEAWKFFLANNWQ